MPYHGWEFGSGGELARRCRRRSPACPCRPPATYRCIARRERYGLVWVCLDDAGRRHPVHLRRTPIRASGESTTRSSSWTTSSTRLTDNFMDFTHFPFVHTGTFGRAQDTVVPRFEVGKLDNGWCGYQYEVDVNNPDSRAGDLWSDRQAMLHRQMSTAFTLPFAVRARSTTRPASSTSCCCSPRRSTT